MALGHGMVSTGMDLPSFEEECFVPQVIYPLTKGKEHMIPIEDTGLSEPSTPDSKRAKPSGFIHPLSESSSSKQLPNDSTIVLQQLEDKC